MSQGLLYGDLKYEDRRIRTIIAGAIIKHFGLDVKIVNPDEDQDRFRNFFPTGKLPAFIGPGGYKLTEVIAVCIYLIQLAPEKDRNDFLGTNLEEKAEVLMWLSFVNCEMLTTIASIFKPLKSQRNLDEGDILEKLKYLNQLDGILELHLAENEYLVGGRLTFADYFAAGLLVRGFNYLYGEKWREDHPHIMNWFLKLVESPFLKDVFGEVTFIDTPLQENLTENLLK